MEEVKETKEAGPAKDHFFWPPEPPAEYGFRVEPKVATALTTPVHVVAAAINDAHRYVVEVDGQVLSESDHSPP